MSSKLTELITEWEGYRRWVYSDHLGYETVGIGRCIARGVGAGISEFEARWLLDRDLERVEEELSDSFAWFDDLDQVRKDALKSMCFQMGLPNLKGFKNALACMENNDFKAARLHFLKSKWARQTPGRALTTCDMFETGEYPPG
jgi:lysozyme